MALCKLTQCCCGCSLQTGTKVIGALFLMGATGGLVQALSQMLLSFDREDGDDMLLDSISWIIGSFAAIAATISVLVAACNNRNPVLIMPWLVLKSVSLTIGIAFVSYMGIMSTRVDSSPSSVTYSTAALVATAIVFYCWLVIFSYYHELVEAANKLTRYSSNEGDEETGMTFRED